jgi:CheY-like chemotaxis protein
VSKLILVIEDDNAVRQTICENLRDCGYEVMEAADGDKGLALLESCTQKPRLVITDIIMPQKEGIETIIAIRRQFPDIKLLAISGGGRTRNMDFLEAARKLGADKTLSKPIDIDELENAVATLMA